RSRASLRHPRPVKDEPSPARLPSSCGPPNGARPGTAAVSLFVHDIGMESDISGGIGLPIDALNLGLEAGKQIAAPFESFEVIDHRARLGAQTFARDDRGNPGRIHYKQCGGDATLDLVDRQIVDVVAYQVPCRLVRRHRRVWEMLGGELRPLQRADVL